MMRLRVIDLETTGTDLTAEVIEFGRVDVVFGDGGAQIDRPMARLYRPLHGIPPETKAVHHITESDFDADTPVCTPERMRLAVWGGETPDVLVAHNCAFERQFITTAATNDLPWICTLKAALHVWPDAPGHSNQVLRYWRDLDLDSDLAMPPHRAGPDAWVSAHILVDLLKVASVEEMIAWTSEPRPMPVVPFGKHRGSAWSEAPVEYLHWMMRQTDMDQDVIWNAGQELARRNA